MLIQTVIVIPVADRPHFRVCFGANSGFFRQQETFGHFHLGEPRAGYRALGSDLVKSFEDCLVRLVRGDVMVNMERKGAR